MSLGELVTRCEDTIRKAMLDKDRGELSSHVLVMAERVLFYFDYSNEEGRDKMRATVELVIGITQTAGVFEGAALISEGWYCPPVNGKVVERPSKSPDRKEGCFYLAYAEGKRAAGFYKILRNEAGKVTQLHEDPSMGRAAEVESWMDVALKPVPEDATSQEVAKLMWVKLQESMKDGSLAKMMSR